MSFNGSGTFLINTAGQPVVSGTVISSTAFNALTADLATGLSTAITKDGQTTVTANIPMSTYKFTGLGVGSAAGDSANLSQVQSTVTKLLTSVSGTDTITAVGAPVVAAYAAGQMFYFVATGDNTGAVTLNIDSLGAKAVTRDGSVALAAGDIKSGEVVVVVYDGTRFQVVSQLNSAGDARFANVSIASSLYVGGVSTFVGNAGFSANVSIASALSVGGVAAITGATTIGGNLTLNGGTANGVLYLNGSKVATSGSALVFDGTNLGIGTASPAAKLDVSAGSAAAQITSTTTSAGAIPKLTFSHAGNDAFSIVGGTYMAWLSSGTTERMRLDSSGNLGLGVTPRAWAGGYKSFDITGPGAIASTASGDTFTQVANGAWFNGTNWIYQYTGIGAARYQMTGPSGGGNHSWHTAASGTAGNAISFTQAMTLDASGNLGIGTTLPAVKLQVKSSAEAFRIEGTTARGSGNIFASFHDPSGRKGYWGYGDSSDNYYISNEMNAAMLFITNAVERARITSGGDLLVGTTSSTARLTVKPSSGLAIGTSGYSGDLTVAGIEVSKFDNNTTTSQVLMRFAVNNGGAGQGQINANGALTAAFGTYSDKRLKENIVDLPPQLSNIMALRPVEFDYIASEGGGHQIGFIAQEFEEVYPDAIGERADGMKTLTGWSKTDARLIKALQEAMARIEQLEAKVATLETK
jgi:hypothetical protein